DSLVSLGGFTGEARQISSVILPELRITDNKTQELLKEYWERRNRFINMSPEERAVVNLPFFDFVFYAFTGKDPDEETKQKARVETEAFFALSSEAENRMYANPTIWKNIIKEFQRLDGVTNLYINHAIKIIERVVDNDIYDSKNVIFTKKQNTNFGGEEEPNFTV
ncbi:MAG: hypothetical protein AABY22_02635, partial [Nanoarchaeota archaeon]